MDGTGESPLVLVVDDDPDVAMVCCLHLEGAGYRLERAGTGRGAVEAARRLLPDVVLLDHMLPDFDGIEVTRRLKADAATGRIPVVMLTARADERDQINAWDVGVSDYLTKPFEGPKLVATVRQALERGEDESVEHRQEAMARLRGADSERHSRLAAILESAGDAVIGETSEGVITYWNAGAERLYGWLEAEVLGSSISVIAVPGNEEELDDILRQVVAGERVEAYETVRMRRDGKRIHVSLQVSTVRDVNGQVVGISRIARDVTERVQMETRFRSLVEAAPDAMVIVDTDGQIELINRQTEVLFGHRREDLVGHRVEIIIPHRLR